MKLKAVLVIIFILIVYALAGRNDQKIAEQQANEPPLPKMGECSVREDETIVGYWDKGQLHCIPMVGPKGRMTAYMRFRG